MVGKSHSIYWTLLTVNNNGYILEKTFNKTKQVNVDNELNQGRLELQRFKFLIVKLIQFSEFAWCLMLYKQNCN